MKKILILILVLVNTLGYSQSQKDFKVRNKLEVGNKLEYKDSSIEFMYQGVIPDINKVIDLINLTPPAASGNNTEIQFNDNGVLGASSNFVYKNGNVGINNSTPTSELDVNGSIQTDTLILNGIYYQPITRDVENGITSALNYISDTIKPSEDLITNTYVYVDRKESIVDTSGQYDQSKFNYFPYYFSSRNPGDCENFYGLSFNSTQNGNVYGYFQGLQTVPKLDIWNGDSAICENFWGYYNNPRVVLRNGAKINMINDVYGIYNKQDVGVGAPGGVYYAPNYYGILSEINTDPDITYNIADTSFGCAVIGNLPGNHVNIGFYERGVGPNYFKSELTVADTSRFEKDIYVNGNRFNGLVPIAGDYITDNNNVFTIGGTGTSDINLEIIEPTAQLYMNIRDDGYNYYNDLKFNNKGIDMQVYDDINESSVRFQHSTAGANANSEILVSNSTGERKIQMSTGGDFIIKDGITNKGTRYFADYSANGLLDPRWNPDLEAVQKVVGDTANSIRDEFLIGETSLVGTYLGVGAGENTTDALNTFIGYQAGQNVIANERNVHIGYQAGKNSNVGNNTLMGFSAGSSAGANNVIIGHQAGVAATGITKSILIGDNAGRNNIGVGNIFIGYQAGYNETGSNKLYIDNSNTPLPLIYGDFSTNQLTINGGLTVTGNIDATGCDIILSCASLKTLQLRQNANFSLLPVLGEMINVDTVPYFYNGNSYERIITEKNDTVKIKNLVVEESIISKAKICGNFFSPTDSVSTTVTAPPNIYYFANINFIPTMERGIKYDVDTIQIDRPTVDSVYCRIYYDTGIEADKAGTYTFGFSDNGGAWLGSEKSVTLGLGEQKSVTHSFDKWLHDGQDIKPVLKSTVSNSEAYTNQTNINITELYTSDTYDL